jgi:hypothetical protein
VREKTTTVLELAGLASVTTGAALIDPAVGFIVGGALAVALGVLLHLAGARE